MSRIDLAAILREPDAGHDVPAFLAPALSGDLDLQRAVLAAGISPDRASAEGGVTALMVAAARDDRALCDLLLDAGADIDLRIGTGEPFFSHPDGVVMDMPALGCAIDATHWALAEHLLERGAKPGFGVMQRDIALTLAKFAPLGLIERIHAAGFPIVFDYHFKLLFAPPVEIQLPEMRAKVTFWAAANPDPGVLGWVLDHGGDPLLGNTLGMTPLIVAAAAGNAPLVEHLLRDGADGEAQDCDGDTALSLAVERGHRAVVEVLRRHGVHRLADKAAPTTQALSARLHEASVLGALGTVLDELDRGLSPNLPDADGNTPLMLAARAGQVATLRALHALGASVRRKNAAGQTVWDLACALEDPRVRVSLREFGADPEHRDPGVRIDALESAVGRYAHPFKHPPRNP